MRWPDVAPFYNFNEFSILLNAKAEFGVYGVFTAEQQPLLIDAGEVMNDLIRLAESGERALGGSPALFSYVLAPYEESMRLKAELMAELLPSREKRRERGR